MSRPRPPWPMSALTVTRPMVVTAAMRSPATMSGVASGSSTRQNRPRDVKPMPSADSFASTGTPSMPRDRVADQDEDGVAHERDLGGQGRQPGDGHQDREQGEAGDDVQQAGHGRDGPIGRSASGGR